MKYNSDYKNRPLHIQSIYLFFIRKRKALSTNGPGITEYPYRKKKWILTSTSPHMQKLMWDGLETQM